MPFGQGGKDGWYRRDYEFECCPAGDDPSGDRGVPGERCAVPSVGRDRVPRCKTATAGAAGGEGVEVVFSSNGKVLVSQYD